MEYRRAYREERVDTGFLDYHRSQIFPLLRRRRLFSGAELFQLFDFTRGEQIDDNVFAFVNGQGSERALVVYHNRDASTAGRIERSVAKRQHGEGSEPVQVGLAEALGLAAGRRLIRFRDQRSNLWYLRTEEELAGGLELTLGAYDFRVFLDFSRVNDPGGHWRHLWHTLAGAPCADPDRAVRQQIAGPLAGQFIHLLRQFAAGAATKQQRKQFDLELLEVYAQLRSLCGLPEHPEIALERAATARAALRRLAASRTKGSADRLLLGRLQAAAGGEILRAWLLLAAACTPPDSRNDLDLIAWWWGDLGLAGAIAEMSPVPGAAALFQLLLRYSGRLARGETGAAEQLAADPQRQELPEGKQGVRRLHDLLLAAAAVTWLWTGRSDAAMLRLATGLAGQLQALQEDDR